MNFFMKICHIELISMSLMVYRFFYTSSRLKPYAFSKSYCIWLKQAFAIFPFLASQALKEVGLTQAD